MTATRGKDERAAVEYAPLHGVDEVPTPWTAGSLEPVKIGRFAPGTPLAELRGMITHDFAIGYRSEDLGASLRLESLLQRREEEAARIGDRLDELHIRRVARSAAGAVMILGSLGMAVSSALSVTTVEQTVSPVGFLLGSWALGAATYVTVRASMRGRLARALLPVLDLGHGPRADLERLEAACPEEEARAHVERWERRSLALPMVGISLLAPLTLHFLVVLVASSFTGSPAFAFTSFNTWIGMSLLIVGHSHLVLAALAYAYARKLSRLSTYEIAAQPHDGWKAYGWTVLSTLPVAILYLIPTILVGVTGLCFGPALFSSMRSRILAERTYLEAA